MNYRDRNIWFTGHYSHGLNPSRSGGRQYPMQTTNQELLTRHQIGQPQVHQVRHLSHMTPGNTVDPNQYTTHVHTGSTSHAGGRPWPLEQGANYGSTRTIGNDGDAGRQNAEVRTGLAGQSTNRHASYQRELDKRDEQIRDLQNSCAQLNREKETLEKELRTKDTQIRDLNDRCGQLDRERDVLKKMISQKELQTEDMYNRMSETQVNHRNPRLENLSTQNRSLRIGERFKSELYGHAWCDAFISLTETRHKESEAAKKLCSMILLVYQETKRALQDAVGKAIEILSFKVYRAGRTDVTTHNTNKSERLDDQSVSADLQSMMKRIMPEKIPESLCKGIVSHLQKQRDMCRPMSDENVRKFAQLGAELCFQMLVQDPPMVLFAEVDREQPVNEKLFSQYESEGPLVDFLVWPALLLHQDGPVLQKGVVQTMTTSRGF